MSKIKPEDLAREIQKTFEEFQNATDDAVAQGVVQCANEAVNDLRNAHPPGSGKYGSWNSYNASWKRTNLKKKKRGKYSDIVHNEKHYQLTHLLERGHALNNGGRAQAFPHIAPVAEKVEAKLIEAIKSNIE